MPASIIVIDDDQTIQETVRLDFEREGYAVTAVTTGEEALARIQSRRFDLAGVTTRRDRDWLVRYLRAPDQMLADQDPIAVTLFAKYKNAPMPNLRLSDGAIAVVLSFLEAQSGGRQDEARQGPAPR